METDQKSLLPDRCALRREQEVTNIFWEKANIETGRIIPREYSPWVGDPEQTLQSQMCRPRPEALGNELSSFIPTIGKPA
jgi:hypothetical protein